MVIRSNYLDFLKKSLGLKENLVNLYFEATEKLKDKFEYLNEIEEINQLKVLEAFWNNKVSDSHFQYHTGYAYDEVGREIIDKVFAQVLGTEDALVRQNIISGTHAIAISLFGILRPNDEWISITGAPYDTLQKLITKSENNVGSLGDFEINYKQVDLKNNSKFDYEAIKNSISNKTKLVFIQKSKGYNFRPELSSSQIGEAIKFIKDINSKIICMVDNCYGELTETVEPSNLSADIIAGSLIKNLGGGIASCGGYVAGKKDLITKISYKLNSIGLGRESGSSLGVNKYILQGLYMSSHNVIETLKSISLASYILEKLGYEVISKYDQANSDVVLAIKLDSEEKLVKFCQKIQNYSAVNSFVTPIPTEMPGYSEKIIMASGSFNMGATSEISADATLKPPYVVYLQGGLTYNSAKIAILGAINALC